MSTKEGALELYRLDPEAQLGPWLVGGMVDLLLQGYLFSQVLYYYRTFPNDKRSLKLLVGGVAILDILKSSQSFAILYRKFAIGFGDFEKAIGHEWIQIVEPLCTAIIGFVVQGYFAHRCWIVLERNWFLLAALLTTMFIGLGGAIALTVFITQMPTAASQSKFNGSVITMLLGMLACDAIIAVTLFYSLWKARTGSPSDTLVNRVMTMIWQCAIPPAFCALMNLAFYVAMSSQNFVFIAWNMVLPKLYTVAMMMTINARARLRQHILESDILPTYARRIAPELTEATEMTKTPNGYVPRHMSNLSGQVYQVHARQWSDSTHKSSPSARDQTASPAMTQISIPLGVFSPRSFPLATVAESNEASVQKLPRVRPPIPTTFGPLSPERIARANREKALPDLPCDYP